MRRAVERTPGIVKKILSPREYDALVSESSEEHAHSSDQFISSLSARYAAKEATVKALGLSLFTVGLHSIEIIKNSAGVPSVVFPTYQTYYPSLDIDVSFHCSLTHSTLSAAAVVIAQNAL